MEVTLALAQYPISQFKSWEEWKTHTEGWVKKAADQAAEIAVFPEYGAMELTSLLLPHISNDLHASIKEMQEFVEDFQKHFLNLSFRYEMVIVAPSFPVSLGERYVNRSYVFSPSGTVAFQDKLFMTRFENEEWGISAGEAVLRVFETPKVTFGIQICYDGEFALGGHLLAQHGAQMILMPSCTETIRGATRVHIGARARALEQQYYVAVSQTINQALWSPAVDINYGYAAIYSSPDLHLPQDGIVAIGNPQEACWLIQKISLTLNELVRETGQVLNYKDNLNIQIRWKDLDLEVENVQLF